MKRLLEVLNDLVAILDSPHTSVSTRYDTGNQYHITLRNARELLRENYEMQKKIASVGR